MNSIDFCFWLQGCIEINDTKSFNEAQTEIIKNHLHLVFKHEIDPLRESQTTTKPNKLTQAHNGNFDNDTLIRC